MSKILITGANGGFGALTVKTLLKQGYIVAASMRNISSKNKAIADELSALGAKVVTIDVTDDESVKKGVAEAINLLGGLDVVVNNAGIGALGIQERFSVEDLKRLFEVNVFGVQRVNKAVLPHLRSQNSGLLIHISSLLGRMAFPFWGAYSMTKFAVEAMAECYRVELSGFGVDSCLIEPGGYPTSFLGALTPPSDGSENDGYSEMQNIQKMAFQGFEELLANTPEQKPQKVANAIAKLIEIPAGQRPMRTIVDYTGIKPNVQPYNELLSKINEAVYADFGMKEMLYLQKKKNLTRWQINSVALFFHIYRRNKTFKKIK